MALYSGRDEPRRYPGELSEMEISQFTKEELEHLLVNLMPPSALDKQRILEKIEEDERYVAHCPYCGYIRDRINGFKEGVANA